MQMGINSALLMGKDGDEQNLLGLNAFHLLH
jgi:hypothetical protein